VFGVSPNSGFSGGAPEISMRGRGAPRPDLPRPPLQNQPSESGTRGVPSATACLRCRAARSWTLAKHLPVDMPFAVAIRKFFASTLAALERGVRFGRIRRVRAGLPRGSFSGGSANISAARVVKGASGGRIQAVEVSRRSMRSRRGLRRRARGRRALAIVSGLRRKQSRPGDEDVAHAAASNRRTRA
jgi:hypothetical protein